MPAFMFIGGGVMARAIVLGCIERGVLAAGEFAVVEPDRAGRSVFEGAGVRAFASIADVVGAVGAEVGRVVVLAVKPQSLPAVAREWEAAGAVFEGVAITMLAGMHSSKVRAALGGRCRVVRAMPNTPARIGQGATAVAVGEGALPGDEEAAVKLFGGIGPLVERVDEQVMDAVTAVSGSGPAYLFALGEAMVRGGVEAGLSAEAADRLVRQTLLGAAGLLAGSAETAGSLRAAVTSKGGTTEAALRVMEERGVGRAIADAVVAARDRGRELGAG